jgi:DNA modification methylase
VTAPDHGTPFTGVMDVRTVPIESIARYWNNPRNNAGAVDKVAASLREFGWRQPIVVDAEGVIIVGDTRYLAALAIGYRGVPVHYATDLPPEKVRAYRIADNRVGEEAEWDDEKLVLELQALLERGVEMATTGMDGDEWIKILQRGTKVKEDAELDQAPPVPKVAVTQLGDRIVLGRHVLVCGDSCEPETWRRLLAGRRAGMVWTDPPYGVSYQGGTKEKLTIENDTLEIPALTVFLRRALSLAWSHSRAGAAWYVAAPHGPQFLAFAVVLSELQVWHETLVWVKSSFALGRSDYHYRHEAIFAGGVEEGSGAIDFAAPPVAPIDVEVREGTPGSREVKENEPVLYGWKPGGAHTWRGGRKQDTVFEVPKPPVNKEHPTMKPVALIGRCIENSAKPDDLIVDPFGGSGSTLMAAEVSGRSAALIELSPNYCDVIVQRWEDATGLPADRPRREVAS